MTIAPSFSSNTISSNHSNHYLIKHHAISSIAPKHGDSPPPSHMVLLNNSVNIITLSRSHKSGNAMSSTSVLNHFFLLSIPFERIPADTVTILSSACPYSVCSDNACLLYAVLSSCAVFCVSFMTVQLMGAHVGDRFGVCL